MMMIPRRRDFDLFDEMFNDPFFTRGENKLMKTDIKDKKDHYELEIDLPGYEKENIKIELADGYLTVHASMNKEVNEDKDSRYVHKERYVGESCVPADAVPEIIFIFGLISFMAVDTLSNIVLYQYKSSSVIYKKLGSFKISKYVISG